MWTDTTKRAYNQTEEDVPVTSLEFKKVLIQFSLTSKHIHHPNVWVLHCRQLNISEKELCRVDRPIEEVKREALDYIQTKLTDMLSAVRNETI